MQVDDTLKIRLFLWSNDTVWYFEMTLTVLHYS